MKEVNKFQRPGKQHYKNHFHEVLVRLSYKQWMSLKYWEKIKKKLSSTLYIPGKVRKER